jgi:propionyl-CoA synthetase
MPGYDVRVVDENCNEVAPNTIGSIVVKLPLPPSCLPSCGMYSSASGRGYLAAFRGHYKTADAGFEDGDG